MPVKGTAPKEWNALFKRIFENPPAQWSDLPPKYKSEQKRLIKARGQQYWDKNAGQIALGQ